MYRKKCIFNVYSFDVNIPLTLSAKMYYAILLATTIKTQRVKRKPRDESKFITGTCNINYKMAYSFSLPRTVNALFFSWYIGRELAVNQLTGLALFLQSFINENVYCKRIAQILQTVPNFSSRFTKIYNIIFGLTLRSTNNICWRIRLF